MIEYYLAQAPAGERDAHHHGWGGEIIQAFSSESEEGPSPPAAAGMNRFLWNMRYPGVRDAPAAGRSERFPRASITHRPRARSRLPDDTLSDCPWTDRTYEQPFEIRKDPRVKASDADLKSPVRAHGRHPGSVHRKWPIP